VYTAQSSCNSSAPEWAMQVGAENERMVDSCKKSLEVKESLVKAKPSLTRTRAVSVTNALHLGLHTILPLPILYGA